jgi:hypothetical protein
VVFLFAAGDQFSEDVVILANGRGAFWWVVLRENWWYPSVVD